MANTTAKLWTVEEVQALPEDGRRYEVIDGVIWVNGVEAPGGSLAALSRSMTPSPSWTHQSAVLTLAMHLTAYLAAHRLGHVISSPADVGLATGVTVQPDIFVVPLVQGRRPRQWSDVGRLLLAVEVLSPSTARYDRVVKRRLYQRAGVPEYWVVDLGTPLIERWRPEDDRAEHLVERLEWRPDAEVAPFDLDLEAYFAEAAGE